jgi:transposase-like protein
MTKRTTDEGALSPASLVPAGGDPASMDAWAAELVARARDEGVALTGEGGLLTDLMRSVLQRGLEVEMAEHLGYERHALEGRGTGNSRNGTYPKTVTTEIGEVTLDVPRDRNGTFEPQTVPKHQRRLEGLSSTVISLYAKGMTTGDIQAHLAEIYGTDVSRETISKITDEIVEDMVAWQNRPLEAVYAVLLIDAIVIKVRGAQVANRPVYVAIGVDLDGQRDVLGLWLGPTGGEGAKQWATMLTELRNRGVADALIVCCDGLKGLPESIRGTWPEATVQTCVVHMVRNSLRYASKKHWSEITRQMRAIYEAPTLEAAKANFDEFAEQWRDAYPAMIRSWENSWDEFVPFLDFPAELRRVVYTTNAIESLNAQFRRGVRHRGHFPNEQAALKVLYLIAIRRRPNRQDLTGQIRGWKTILNTLTIHYGDRITAASY